MRTNLAIMVIVKRGESPIWFYLPGQNILEEVANSVSSAESQASKLAPSLGSEDAPLVLKTTKEWISAFTAMRSIRSSSYHFNVAGRLIKKWPDRGHNGHADGMYLSDKVLSGTDDIKGRVWNREEGASYREFARFMAECMPTGNELAWSEELTVKMRKMLRNEENANSIVGTDIGSALPLLCSVMFLAEPARNKRAWPIGLMMFDLIGHQYSKRGAPRHYTWERVLSHPERIDFGFKGSSNVSKRQLGPIPNRKSKTPTGLGQIIKKNQLVNVEGKLPASPKGSASTGWKIDVANDYIQMKELSLTIRWLQRALSTAHADNLDVEFVTWPASESLDDLTNLANDDSLRNLADETTLSGLGINFEKLKKFQMSILSEIRDILNQRCNTFDAML